MTHVLMYRNTKAQKNVALARMMADLFASLTQAISPKYVMDDS